MAGGRIISLVDAAKQRIAALRDPAAKVSGGWKGRLPGLSPRPSPETGLAPDAVSTGSPRLAASRLTLPRFALPGIAPAEITSLPRKLALGVTVLAVALGAGRFVQSDHEARRMDIAEGRPSAITPLAASADFAAPRLLPELGLLPELAKPVPVADRAADAEPVRTVGALPAAETDPAQPGPEDVGALREPGTPRSTNRGCGRGRRSLFAQSGGHACRRGRHRYRPADTLRAGNRCRIAPRRACAFGQDVGQRDAVLFAACA